MFGSDFWSSQCKGKIFKSYSNAFVYGLIFSTVDPFSNCLRKYDTIKSWAQELLKHWTWTVFSIDKENLIILHQLTFKNRVFLVEQIVSILSI